MIFSVSRIRKSPKNHFRYLQIILSLLLFYHAFLPISYTCDWNGYERMFYGLGIERDLLFTWLSNVFINFGFDFQDLYKFHIYIIGILLILFVIKFTDNPLFVIIFLIFYRYVQYSNQIRYYLGFFLYLYGTYLILVKKNKPLGLILYVVSLCSHSGIITLMLFPLIYKYIIKTNRRLQILYLLLAFLAWNIFIVATDIIAPQFSKYISIDQEASFSGGLLYMLPVILIYFIIAKQNARQKINDEKYNFLYGLSLFSFMFIPFGIKLLIIFERYICSFSIIWILYFLYNYYNKVFSEKVKLKDRIYPVIVLLLAFSLISYFYFAPFIAGDKFYFLEAVKTFLSTIQ